MSEFLFFMQLFFAVCFVVTLGIGGYLAVNFQRLFGVDSTHPSEGGSARAYSKVSIFSVWAHAVVLFGALALMLH